jgi:hypothetical protein
MQPEAPDTQFFGEIRDLNLAFLALAVQARELGQRRAFGLDAAVLDGLRRLPGAGLEAIAATPCLLVGFRAEGARERRWCGVAEAQPVIDSAWVASAQLFAATLLGHVWHLSRCDPLRASLCAGDSARGPAGLGSFREVCATAGQALQLLEARFHTRVRFWPDLVTAARDGHSGRLQLARLTAIHLASAELAMRHRQALA